MNPYSPLKIFHHRKTLDILREGRQPNPTHVQLILSDTCNQSCGFCVKELTSISTPLGNTCVERILLGDDVYGASGEICRVTGASSREVDALFKITASGRVLYVTGEHPILTIDGWRLVSELSEGVSQVAVRVEERGCFQSSLIEPDGVKLEGGIRFRVLDKIEHIQEKCRVYNFSCDPSPTYEANGFVVHNCAYRSDGYTSNANFFTLNPDGSHNNNPKRIIPTAKVVEILNDCRSLGVKAIQFTGGGEPTVHPDHLSLINLAIDNGFDCGLVTNGVIQRPGIVETTARLSWVRYSVDAGTKETYASLRKSSPETFAKVWSHIEEVCRVVRHNKTGTLIGVGFVVTAENWKEVFKCAQLAKDVGAHNFRISAVFQNDDDKYFGEFYQECATLCRNTVTMLEDKDFKVFNMFGDRLDDLRQAHPDYEKCHYQQVTTYIGGDLNVYRCCNTSYNDLGLIGSIKERRFKDLWLSEEKRKKFEEFDARGCPRCQFNHKNKTMAYALDEEPTHVSFL